MAHSFEEAARGRGFYFELVQQDLIDKWQLVWVKNYSFMGHYYEKDIPEKWSHLSHKISHNFPKDGANFCAAWKRYD